MAMTRKEILKKMAEADASAGGNFILDGRYRLAVTKFELTEGFKGNRVVFEFVVMNANKVPVVRLKDGMPLDISPNPVGSAVSYVQLLDKHENAFNNFKALMLALFGEKDASKEELVAAAEELLDNGTAYGMVIDCVTFRKITQKNAVEIVIPKWSYVPQTGEDIKKTRAWIESLTLATAKETGSGEEIPF